MSAQTLLLDGKAYVVVPRDEYEMMSKAAKLPPLPEPDASGRYPALEYARASLARDIIRERIEAGFSQQELAKRAGIRVETLCRIETGKVTPSISSVDKIDRALREAIEQARASRTGRTRGTLKQKGK